MEPWQKPILARVNGTVDAHFAAETEAVRRLWTEYTGLLSSRPALDAVVMTAVQLTVLTKAAHMHGMASDMTREIMAAFGLVWGWPADLHEADRRLESQQVLVSARPVPVAVPVPVPVPVPPEPALVSPATPVLAAPSGFVELPKPPVQPPVPAPAPEPAPEPPKPPVPPPGNNGERARGRDSAVVTRIPDPIGNAPAG